MMTLEHEMTYRLKTRGPLGTTDGSPIAARQYWEMSEATLIGPRIKAKLGMPGGDWMVYGLDTHVKALMAEPRQAKSTR